MGIYIWGTGCSAGDLFDKGLPADLVTAFVETAPQTDTFLGKPVLNPRQLPVHDAELILIASRHTEAIRKQCLSLGLKQENLFFLKNACVLQDQNTACTKAKELLSPQLLEKLVQPCRIIREPAASCKTLTPSDKADSDYVRIKTLELLVQSIAHVPGSIAELGVYKGFFSQIMNHLMPDRTLYLFDSFEGFLPEEAQKEQALQTCGEGLLAAHRNTATEQVLKSMPYPEQIILCPGYFPQSLNGLEERFALVSLDADFEDTTYEGLSYFWPRLNSGGYLMLHDYNSPNLTGVRKAVQRYEKDHGIHLPGVPLCDICGSLILCKP